MTMVGVVYPPCLRIPFWFPLEDFFFFFQVLPDLAFLLTFARCDKLETGCMESFFESFAYEQ